MTNEERAHEVALTAVNYVVGSQSSKECGPLVVETYNTAYWGVMMATAGKPSAPSLPLVTDAVKRADPRYSGLAYPIPE